MTGPSIASQSMCLFPRSNGNHGLQLQPSVSPGYNRQKCHLESRFRVSAHNTRKRLTQKRQP